MFRSQSVLFVEWFHGETKPDMVCVDKKFKSDVIAGRRRDILHIDSRDMALIPSDGGSGSSQSSGLARRAVSRPCSTSETSKQSDKSGVFGERTRLGLEV